MKILKKNSFLQRPNVHQGIIYLVMMKDFNAKFDEEKVANFCGFDIRNFHGENK